MNILISTGIYPPKIGGPAQYALNLNRELMLLGHTTRVVTFDFEDKLPTGIRHAYFFFRILPSVFRADHIIALDTFSVGLPTVCAAKLLGKKVAIRSGGDFLWEGYVERTGKKVLLRDFYKEKDLSFKERMILQLTRWTLTHASWLIFSTEWQKEIFIEAYNLDAQKISIIENYYGPKEDDLEPKGKLFLASTRNLKWKNTDMLKEVFTSVKTRHPETELFLENMEFSYFMNTMRTSYAVIQVSLGDISPNLILDAIRHNRPFICTKEVGIFDRIKDAGVFVDPLNPKEIEEAVLALLGPENYAKAKEKVRQFSFIHTWKEIAAEFLEIITSIST